MDIKELSDEYVEFGGKVRRKLNWVSEVFGWADWGIFPLLFLTLFIMFITRFTMVDGSSMLPTLVDKQVLLFTDFMYQPAHNDIVVVYADKLPLHDGTDNTGKPIVKRVIGLAGDTIDIDFDEGRVTRNGELLEIKLENGQLWEDGHMINSLTNAREGSTGHFTVPEGYVFVMGDNRNDSTDSRSSYVGYVDRNCIMGKVYIRLFPFDSFGLLTN